MKHRPRFRVLSIAAFATALAAVARPLRAQAAGDSADVTGLPLVEVAARDTGRTFVLFLTGDGGWADIDKKIGERMAERGLPVVGFNLRDYLKQQRAPDDVGRDVARIMRRYAKKWNRDRVVVVGFSRGANLAPFALTRLPEELRNEVPLVAMIGLNRAANFKWHFQDLFRDIKRPDDVPTIPEIEKLSSLRMLCIYGSDEKESGCRDTPPNVRRIERNGGHHLDGDYRAIADLIVDAAEH
jgi:type IV secretory pathway VirJ component